MNGRKGGPSAPARYKCLFRANADFCYDEFRTATHHNMMLDPAILCRHIVTRTDTIYLTRFISCSHGVPSPSHHALLEQGYVLFSVAFPLPYTLNGFPQPHQRHCLAHTIDPLADRARVAETMTQRRWPPPTCCMPSRYGAGTYCGGPMLFMPIPCTLDESKPKLPPFSSAAILAIEMVGASGFGV
jgi:hypothetical protein